MILTKLQRKAIHKVWLRTLQGPEPKTYKQFRKAAFGGYGCVMVPFAGMYLGIEPDGHTHS